MSTRANIVIYDLQSKNESENRWKPVYLYHHQDGYIEGVGADLLRLIQCEGYKMTDKSATEQIILSHSCYDGHEPGDYEKTTGLHGDIEFLYIIELNDGWCKEAGQRITLTARKEQYEDGNRNIHDPRNWGKPLNGFGCDFIGSWCRDSELHKGKDIKEYTDEELMAELTRRLNARNESEEAEEEVTAPQVQVELPQETTTTQECEKSPATAVEVNPEELSLFAC